MHRVVKGDKATAKPAVSLNVPIDPQLKALVFQAADECGLTMNEWVARVLARALKRPELARIPRKRLGRPPSTPLVLNGSH